MFPADDLQYEVFPERGNRIMRGWIGRKRVWRWLAVFMAALLTAVSVSTTALAAETDSESYSANGNNSEDDYSDSGSSQQTIYWMFDDIDCYLYLFDETSYTNCNELPDGEFYEVTMEDFSAGGEAPWSEYDKETAVLYLIGDIYVGSYAFYESSITIIYIYGTIDVGKSAFFGCTGLRSIKGENTEIVTANSIGERAFCGCTSLEEICLSSDVTEISKNAFAGCYGLTINYGGTISSWEEINEDLDTYDTWDIQVNYGLANYGTWGEKNIEDIIELSEYCELFGEVWGEELFDDTNDSEGEKHGLCYGMVITAAATLYYDSPVVESYYNNDTLETAESLYDITDAEKWASEDIGMTALQYIHYAHITQWTGSYQSDKKRSRTADLNDIAEAALNFKNDGQDPVMLCIRDIPCKKDGKTSYEAHALLIVDVGRDDDSVLELIVYDPNDYEYTQSLYLLREDGEITGWIYETYEGAEENGDIWGSDYGETLYGGGSEYIEYFMEGLSNGFEYDENENYTLFKTTIIETTIYLTSWLLSVVLRGSLTEGADNAVTYILTYGASDEGSGGDSSAYAYWIEGEEEVVVTVPEGGGSYSYSAYTSGVSVELSDAAEVMLRSGNEIEDEIWITNSLDQEYVMKFAVAEDVDEDSEEEYVAILVSGQTSGDVSGRLTEEGVVLSGDIAVGTELTLEIDGETVYTLIVTQEVIDASEESLTVIRTDEETLVIGTLSDSDADPNTDESNDTESDGDEGGSDSSDTTDTEDAQTMEEESETGTDSGESEASSDDTSTGETEDSGTNEGTDDADTEEITETESTTADAGTSSTDATESGATAISEDASETQAEGSQTAADPEGSGSDAEIAETEMLSEEEENNSDAGIDRGAAATGDDGDVNFWLVLMLVTAAGLGTAVYVMRRQKRQG